MTAKEFLTGKTLTAVETVDGKILNLVMDEEIKGLDIDTSQIQAGTQITRYTQFDVVGDILTCNDISIDLSTTNVLTLPPFLQR
jgi:hypothetical protein